MEELRKRYKHLITLTILLLIGVSCSKKKDQSENQQENSKNIELSTLSGESISLSELKGKVIFLNIWATWCAPCIKEMPSIEAISTIFNGDVEFLIASNEEIDKIIRFKERKPFDLNFVQLGSSPESLGVFALPATFIFDKKGELVFEEKGSRAWDSEESKNLIKNIINNE